MTLIQNTSGTAEKVYDAAVMAETNARMMTSDERAFFLRCRNSCKKCNGTGSAGFQIVEGTKKRIACQCVLRALQRIAHNRIKPFDGLEFGRTYSVGRYAGLKEDTIMGGLFHAFETMITNTDGVKSDLYIPVTDKARVAEIRAEERREIIVQDAKAE